MGRVMQSSGLTSATGRAFSPQSLYQLFTNPYYAGVIVDPWSGEEYPGKQVAMVTQEEFEQVQRVIAARNRSVKHQKENPVFPLRGVVRCDGCHRYFTGAFSRGRNRQYPYYVCHCRSCPKRGKSVAAAEIHDEFETFLGEITPKPEALRDVGNQIVNSAAKRQAELELRGGHRRKRAAQLDRELQELIRMRAQNLLTDDEFLHQKTRLLAERAGLGTPNWRKNALSEARHQLQEIMIPLTELRETWRSLKPDRRRRFDRMLLPAGFVAGRSRTADKGLLFSTISTSAGSNSSEVSLTSEKLNQIVQEIQCFWEVLHGIDEPERPPKRRFDNSHRNRLRMRESNPK
jgi:hypothetical protein